jgi:hypothetical protein
LKGDVSASASAYWGSKWRIGFVCAGFRRSVGRVAARVWWDEHGLRDLAGFNFVRLIASGGRCRRRVSAGSLSSAVASGFIFISCSRRLRRRWEKRTDGLMDERAGGWN